MVALRLWDCSCPDCPASCLPRSSKVARQSGRPHQTLLRDKVEGLIKEFGAVQDRLQNNYTKGLVDGFDRPLVPQ